MVCNMNMMFRKTPITFPISRDETSYEIRDKKELNKYIESVFERLPINCSTKY